MARSESVTDDAADSRDEDLAGRTFGKYTLVRVIGRGGMGVVYEAHNTTIGKRVAIKLVSADLAKNQDAVRRFQREAQAASAVESAHIVDIFDAGMTDEGVPYLVMELLRGEDLGHRIKRLGRLELDDALNLTAQILRGLGRAHTAGIIHRDLKPDNVFLVDRDDDSTFVKILDFGISKVARMGGTPVQTLTKEGTVLGTPLYMSPEQAQGLPDTDGRADLWSVGAILYESLTGRAPHTGASYEQVIVNICTKDPADVRVHNPAVPEEVAKAIAKALAREREDRFASARDMLEGLAAASGGLITLSQRASDEVGATSGRARSSSPSSPSGERVSSSARTVSGHVVRAASGSSSFAPVGSGRPSGSDLEDTVELFKGGGPSRVGWSTSDGPAVRRDRKRMLLVGLGALVLCGAGAAALVLRGSFNLAVDDGASGSDERAVAQVGAASTPMPQTEPGANTTARADPVVASADPVVPTAAPTVTPHNGAKPGTKPSATPSAKPSAAPSSVPSAKPSAAPSTELTAPPLPSKTASPAPTLTIKRE